MRRMRKANCPQMSSWPYHASCLSANGRSFGKSTNSLPYMKMPLTVTPTIAPQNSKNNMFSVLYSCGNVADAKNMATAKSSTDGNYNRNTEKMQEYNFDCIGITKNRKCGMRNRNIFTVTCFQPL